MGKPQWRGVRHPPPRARNPVPMVAATLGRRFRPWGSPKFHDIGSLETHPRHFFAYEKKNVKDRCPRNSCPDAAERFVLVHPKPGSVSSEVDARRRIAKAQISPRNAQNCIRAPLRQSAESASNQQKKRCLPMPQFCFFNCEPKPPSAPCGPRRIRLFNRRSPVSTGRSPKTSLGLPDPGLKLGS